MMQVAGDQSAKIARIFARAATAALVREKLHAIDVLEKTAMLLPAVFCRLPIIFNRINASFAIELCQIGHLFAINLRRCVSESLVESLAQHVDVAVLTKNQRH